MDSELTTQYGLSERELMLKKWVGSLFRKCVEEISLENQVIPNYKLFIDHYYHKPNISLMEGLEKYPEVWEVFVPFKDADAAFEGKNRNTDLFSGKQVSYAVRPYLINSLFHEAAHLIYPFKEPSFEEAIADRIAQERTILIPGGANIVGLYLANYLVDANYFGFAEFTEIRKINLSFRLLEDTLGFIQEELDFYFSNKEIVAEKIEKRVKSWPEDRKAGYEDYSKGFVQLLGRDLFEFI
ncbi:hypothetical protein HOC13_04315 [Candidatus Woesearchaeota archaeon]|jgi:hypothetical protein|nr:hypothetical protein [Candidatus Woesearchaeota archaeon]